ncbi:DNA-processing protein DprA [Cupriavidus sp. AU9028]|uniref:DNA-processing protein DprA n=1 Tax=Cupriavidus sp. AU9028 TaxID=2871157 RepID=UPI001C939B3E|nr:DNA-processing protein DprA [Cupriavidus sp. AU9028]MBY4897711.1 DNA-processing protein DprA [Cupriavidus sp. AU9028]
MTDPEEIAAWLRLTGTPGLSAVAARRLLAAFGLPQQILATPVSRLAQVVPATLARRLLAAPDDAMRVAAARTATWAAQPGQAVIGLADPSYPVGLLDLTDPPLLLFARGNPDLLRRQAVAVVGARNATQQGERDAQRFARRLSEAGWLVVSGLAHGIDAAAHAGGMQGPAGTLAVVGTGVDRVYPESNRALSDRLAAEALIVSELPLGTPPRSLHFPRRNRLIAALSRGVVVIEAALRSGSLITARLAAELGREVFALPGSIHAPQSQGCHQLIRQGAMLVESAEEVLAELGTAADSAGCPVPAPSAPARREPLEPLEPLPAPSPTPLAAGLEHSGTAVLAAIAYDPVGADALAARTGLPVALVTAALLGLELGGAVESLPGNRYRRLA